MSTHPFDELRGVLAGLDLLERQVPALVRECRAAGVEAAHLADLLGVSRATLYRRYFPTDDGAGQAVAVGEAIR